MRYALVFTRHDLPPRGPITRSLFQAAERKGIPLRFTSRDTDWDDFDFLIWFHNRPPPFQTTAKIGWWLCDARTVQRLRETSLGSSGYANHIFLCNNYLLKDFAEFYGGEAHHVPQCGDDMPEEEGRSFGTDCVFIGNVPELNPQKRRRLVHSLPPKLIGDDGSAEDFQWSLNNVHKNRYPIIRDILNAGISVHVLQGERVSRDQKFIYRTTPFCLAISPQIPGYTSNRLYNILAAKGFCLTLKYPGIEESFENHKHLVWFSSIEEAIELVRFYKERPAKMQKIRDEGYAEYQKAHSAEKRIEQMIKLAFPDLDKELK